jgi:hypothetical protein
MRGRPAMVIVSQQEYLKFRKPNVSFIELMQNAPLTDADIEFERDRSDAREISFN